MSAEEMGMIEECGAILVVDDDADMREMVHDMLKDRGHQVTTAGNGQEALKILGEEDYAVVLTDLRMKGMQGLELLAEIKRLHPEINVILMTAFGSFANPRFVAKSIACGRRSTRNTASIRFWGRARRCRGSSI